MNNVLSDPITLPSKNKKRKKKKTIWNQCNDDCPMNFQIVESKWNSRLAGQMEKGMKRFFEIFIAGIFKAETKDKKTDRAEESLTYILVV